MTRLQLLADVGIQMPTHLGSADTVAPDDVLDAAVAAWTAGRIARGQAKALPEQYGVDPKGRAMAIWY